MPASWYSGFNTRSSPWGCKSCSGTATVTPFPHLHQPLAERDRDGAAAWQEQGMVLPSPKSCLSLPKAFNGTEHPLCQDRSLGASPRAPQDADVMPVRLPKALPSGRILAHAGCRRGSSAPSLSPSLCSWCTEMGRGPRSPLGSVSLLTLSSHVYIPHPHPSIYVDLKG